MSRQMTEPVAIEPGEERELEHHPSPKTYVGVAVILAFITAVEVAMSYIDALRVILVPTLIVLAVVKFSMVVLWFMHLRFDSRIFKRLFITGLTLALAVFGIVLWFFFTHGGAAPTAG